MRAILLTVHHNIMKKDQHIKIWTNVVLMSALLAPWISSPLLVGAAGEPTNKNLAMVAGQEVLVDSQGNQLSFGDPAPVNSPGLAALTSTPKNQAAPAASDN